MTQETLIPKKRRGPAPTGKGVPVMVRVQPDLIQAVDAFILERVSYGESLSRPEAVRRLAAEALEKMGLLGLPEDQPTE